jgi:hypothetical protein
VWGGDESCAAPPADALTLDEVTKGVSALRRSRYIFITLYIKEKAKTRKKFGFVETEIICTRQWLSYN